MTQLVAALAVLGIACGLGLWLRRSGAGRDEAAADSGPSIPTSGARPPPEQPVELEAILKAFGDGRLSPPKELRSANAWDEYWRNMLQFGQMEIGFGDMMASDSTLIELLRQRGVRTILCAGNGMSSEALALALFGFEVTALDLSLIPAAFFDALLRDPNYPLRNMPGLVRRDDGRVVFGVTGPIGEEWCPPIHREPGVAHSGGGSLRQVAGDLLDASVSPGPFDAVIERRTLQLLMPADQVAGLRALEARMAPRSVLVSHQHNGGWRPGEDREHYAESWVRERGYARRGVSKEADETAARLAHLCYSSG